MPLPWVRLDSNVGQHDKILALKHDPSPRRWQAMASYFVSLAWSGGQGTDGFIPAYALESVHATPQTARILVKYRLWTEGIAGYQIVNFEERQELAIVTEAKRAAQSLGGKKARCRSNHGPNCGCWRDAS
jgi:hypothetical protein